MPAPFPIQEVQVGAVAYVHGVMNNGTEITLTGLASFVPIGDEITSTWTEKEKKDASSSTQNIIMTDPKLERTIEVEVTSSTRAAAAASASALLTPPQSSSNYLMGGSVTVANHAVAIFNGAWRIKTGVKISMKQDDELKISIPCEKWVNTSQNSALTGTPISG